MIAANEQDDLMVRYLLGDVTEGERTQIEERFLSDHDYYEQLLAVEDKLVDQYATDNLPVEKRELFDNSSVSQRREKVEFTRELIRDIREHKLESKKSVRPSVFRVIFTRRYIVSASLAAAILLLLIAVPWILVLSLEQRLTETQRELTVKEREATEQIKAERRARFDIQQQLVELQHSAPGNGTDLLLSTPLKPYRGQRAGGSEVQVVEVSARLQVVILDISLEKPGSYESYRVRITPSESLSPLSVSGLTLEMDRSTLKVPITAAKLEPGDYVLTVLGEENNQDPVILDSYSFKVKRTD